MRLAPDILLDGVLRTLRDAVLPAVHGRFARGQLFAVLDVLQNLRDRIEPRVALDATEAESAAGALRRALDTLAPERAAPLLAALAEVPTEPPAARVAALRALLVRTFETLDALPDDLATPARGALAEHLAAQAMRDVALLKPSLLHEISKG